MAARPVKTHGPLTCALEVTPAEIDAGAEVAVTVRVSCPHGCDLSGQIVAIRDGHDPDLAIAQLTEFDGEAYLTGALVFRAPSEVGEHSYRAVLAPAEAARIPHEETSTVFSFATRAHAAMMNVWGLPSATAAGERFRLKVGVKCSAGCNLASRPVSLFDHRGEQVGTANLFDHVWPGTTALYFAEIEAPAPSTPGDYEWQVKAPEWDSELPHAGGSFNFHLKIVRSPDHEVTIEAFDSDTNRPIKGAHVLLHPYRAYTDESGVAKLKVAKGRYKLFVSGFNYTPYEKLIDVAGGLKMRVELAVEPEEQVDYG